MPSEEELADLYDSYSYDRCDLSQVPEFVFRRLAETVDGFESHRRTNRLLDVGFGAGAMLQAARGRDWEVHGVEISHLAVAQARKNGFMNIVEGDFLRAPYEDGFFDVIVATELLEHLPEPLPFIKRASELLAPWGVFSFTTPNSAGLSCRLLGVDWSVVSPPEHFQLFSPRSITIALSGHGFHHVALDCEGFNPFETLRCCRSKLHYGTVSEFDRNASSSALNERLTADMSGRALKSAANWFLRATRLGDSLKASASK